MDALPDRPVSDSIRAADHVLIQLGGNKTIIVWIVRKSTFRATLDVFLLADVFERTAAMFAERIQRTITKQAVESFGIAIFVAGKIATLDVSEKFVSAFCHGLLIINQLRQIHHISACRVVHVCKHIRCRCIGNKLNMPVTKRHIDSASVLTA